MIEKICIVIIFCSLCAYYIIGIYDFYKQDTQSTGKAINTANSRLHIHAPIKTITLDKPSSTLAVRNKNLLNIKQANTKWKGQVGTDRYGHVIFSSWEYGIRAAAYVLKNYHKKYKIDTIEKIVKKFTEKEDRKYIKFLCKELGLRPDQKFNIVKRMSELLKAMARYESGQKLPDELFIPYDILASM